MTELLNEKYMTNHNPSTGTHENEIYYVFNIPKTQQQINQEINDKPNKTPKLYTNALITSQKKIVHSKQWKEQQYYILQDFGNDESINTRMINQILQNQNLKPINQTYNETITHLKNHLDLDTEEHYHIATLHAIGSWITQKFNYYPILFITGDKGSGKTKLAYYLSKIGFRSDFKESPTKAYLTRQVQNTKGYFILEEMENLNDKIEYKLLLNSGCQKGMKTALTETKHTNGKWETEIKEIYTAYAIISINRIYGATADRTIMLQLRRTLNDKQEINDKDTFYEQTRTQILNYFLEHHHKYDNYDDYQPPKIHLKNRNLQFWKPLLYLCHQICPQNEEQLINYANKNYMQQKEDLFENDMTTRIVHFLNNINPQEYKASQLYTLYRQNEMIDDTKLTMFLFSNILNMIGYRMENNNKKRKNDGIYYDINKKTNTDYLIRYNLQIEEIKQNDTIQEIIKQIIEQPKMQISIHELLKTNPSWEQPIKKMLEQGMIYEITPDIIKML